MFDELEYYQNYKLEAGEIDLRSYLLDEEHLEEKVHTGEYPTIHVLQDLQRQKGEGPRDPDSKSEPPFPPHRRKNEIFDATKFVEKDAYVSSLLPEPAESDESFAERLFAKCSSNLDRVRAAFVFVSSAKVDSMSEVENESALYTQVRKLHANDGADALFQKLAQFAAVPVKRIDGYKKGAGNRVGFECQGGGSWFACYVEGEWRFVDPYWGSNSIVGFESSDFAEIGDDGNLKAIEKTEGKKNWSTREYYFLTDPENLVLSHLPKDDIDVDLQLLACPLSRSQFQKMPRVFQGFQEYMEDFMDDVKLLSHPLNVIVARPGSIDVRFLETGGELRYSPSIGIHTKDITEESRAKIKTQMDEKGFLVRPARQGKGVVQLKFVPPCAGKFELKVSIEKAANPQSQSVHFVTYVIHCPRAQNPRARPKGAPLPPYFGAGGDLCKAQLSTPEPGEILAHDGEHALIVDCVDSNPHRLRSQLMDASNETLPTKNAIILPAGRRFIILFLSPNSGSFALLIYDGDVPVCQFLLDAPSEYRDAAEFPLPQLDRLPGAGLGFFQSELSSLIEPVSHADPHVVCTEATLDLTFNMNQEVQAEIEAELLHIDNSGEGKVSPGYAFVSRGSNHTSCISLRFPIAGHYVLRVNGRSRRSDSMRLYCNYFIRSLGEVNGLADQFPETLSAWSSRNRLVLPRCAVLPVEETVQFAVEVSDPSVNSLCIEVEDTPPRRYPMNKTSSGLWKGEIKGKENSKAAKSARIISESTSGNKNICEDLLKYRFESEVDTNIRNEMNRTAFNLNKSRRAHEQVRKRKQENFFRAEEGNELLPERPDVPASEKLDSRESTMRWCFRIFCTPDNLLASKEQHQIIQAALLLLGHCEDETQTWDRCRGAMRKCLREQVKPDAARINPSIAVRAQALVLATSMSTYEIDYVKQKPVRELRKWVESIASEVLAKHPQNPPPAPALNATQREIFGVPADLFEAWQ